MLLHRRGAGQEDAAAALHEAPVRAGQARAARCFGIDPVHAGRADRRCRAGVLPHQEGRLPQAPRPHLAPDARCSALHPAKGQELEEHYFGAIRPTVSDFMKELDDRAVGAWHSRQDQAQRGRSRAARARPDLRRGQRRRSTTTCSSWRRMKHLCAATTGWYCLHPREALRRHQRLGQAQQLVASPRRGPTCSTRATTPPDNTAVSSSVARRRHRRPSTTTRSCCARPWRLPATTTVWAAHEAPPAIMSIFLGDRARGHRRGHRRRARTPYTPRAARSMNLGVRCSAQV